MTHSRTRIIARGLLALAGILVTLFVLPAALWALGGNPLPDHLPTLQEATTALSQPDDGRLLLRVLTVVAWAAWASLALSLLVEIPAALRGVQAPRIPGLSWQQGRAAALAAAVGAMIAVGSSAATAAPASTPTAAPQASSVTATVQTSTAPSITPAAPTTPTPPTGKTVTVTPGQTLWGIAEDQLGNGTRYPQIAAASMGITQPDGAHLTDPDLIRPGWQLRIPGAAPASIPAHAPAPRAATPHTSAPAAAPAAQAGAAHTTPGDTTPGVGLPSDAAASPATPAAEASRPARSLSTGPDATTTDDSTAATLLKEASNYVSPISAIGLGSLACAGLLTVLARKRDTKGRSRRPGRRRPTPLGPAANAEAQMVAGSDPMSVNDLRTLLVALTARARAGKHPTPSLRAARITADALELYVVEEDLDLGHPLRHEGAGVWVVDRARLAELDDPDHASIEPAWPGLIDLGADPDGAHVLLNLEQVGVLTLTGDQEAAYEVLCALGLETITSSWTSDAHAYTVGVMTELVDALGSERVEGASDVDAALGLLEATSRASQAALSEAGVDEVAHARVSGVCDSAWTCTMMLTDHDLTPEQAERITDLVEATPHPSVGILIAAPTPVGEWSLHIETTPDGQLQAQLGPVPVTLTPQRLTRQAYRDQIALFTDAEADDTEGPDWTEGIDPAGPVDLTTLPTPPAPTTGELTEAYPRPITTASATSFATSTLSSGQRITDDEDAGEKETPEATPDAHEPTTNDIPTAGDTATPDVDEESAKATEEPTPVGEDPAEQAVPVDDELTDDESAPAEPTPDAPTPTPVPVDDQAPTHDNPHLVPLPTPQTPTVRVLGPVTVDGARGPRATAIKRSTEIVVYLALRPGQSTEAFNEAIFPGERASDRLSSKRNNYMRNARSWLGKADDELDFVALVPDHGYRLHPDVRLDWDDFRELIGPAIGQAPTEDLRQALALVTGQPLSGLPPKRYEWAGADIAEIRQAVADVAHEVAHRCLEVGDHRTAAWAAEKGLAADPVLEALWRDAITAAWQSGVPGTARAVIDRAQALFDELGTDMEDETYDLINDTLSNDRAHA